MFNYDVKRSKSESEVPSGDRDECGQMGNTSLQIFQH